MCRSAYPHFASALLALFIAACSDPETPPLESKAPPFVIARAEHPIAEAKQGEPTTREPLPHGRPEPALPTPAAATATPWGAPLQVTGNSHGLRWTTTAQVERNGDTVQLALEVELHNSTRAPMPVSLHPPRASVMTTPVPGSSGEGLGLGLRGEGMGSDVCSPGHGGPAMLPAGGRGTAKRTVELDPLPWPPGQALRVTATSSDCRKGRLTLEVLDVTILQPATPDGVPTLMPTTPSSG